MTTKDIIERKTKELEQIMVKDFQAASRFYTEDCVIMMSNGEIVTGRNGVTKFLEKSYGGGTSQQVISKIFEVLSDGDLAVARGSYVVRKGEVETRGGNFVHVWKKVNSDYEMHYDIWNEPK